MLRPAAHVWAASRAGESPEPLWLAAAPSAPSTAAGPSARSAKPGPMLRKPTRLLALGGLVLAGFLYWQPLSSYVKAREVLAQRQAEVAELREEKRRLARRLASVDRGATLIAEARRLGLVKPGERLVIVRGVEAWRERQAAKAGR